jgi:hypothetical protein
MSAEDTKQEFARQSCFAFLRRVTVLVFPHGSPSDSGTGILLRATDGTPCLLTARHLVEDVQNLRIAINGESIGTIENAGEQVFLGPERPESFVRQNEHSVDVALVTLRKHASDQVATIVGDTAIAETSEVQPDDVVVISGFPTYLSQAKRGPGAVQIEAGSIAYVTGVLGRDDHGRLKVEWSDATMISGGTAPPHIQRPHGEIFKLGHPSGISGGGVWRVRGPSSKSELWSPGRHCQLIGIAVAVSVREAIEFAEPVELWRDWLQNVKTLPGPQSGGATVRAATDGSAPSSGSR